MSPEDGAVSRLGLFQRLVERSPLFCQRQPDALEGEGRERHVGESCQVETVGLAHPGAKFSVEGERGLRQAFRSLADARPLVAFLHDAAGTVGEPALAGTAFQEGLEG